MQFHLYSVTNVRYGMKWNAPTHTYTNARAKTVHWQQSKTCFKVFSFFFLPWISMTRMVFSLMTESTTDDTMQQWNISNCIVTVRGKGHALTRTHTLKHTQTPSEKETKMRSFWHQLEWTAQNTTLGLWIRGFFFHSLPFFVVVFFTTVEIILYSYLCV